MSGCRHDATELAFLVNGTLDGQAEDCPGCRREIAGWQAIADSMDEDPAVWAAALPPAETLVAALDTDAQTDARPAASRGRRLLRWILPALLLALGGAAALFDAVYPETRVDGAANHALSHGPDSAVMRPSAVARLSRVPLPTTTPAPDVVAVVVAEPAQNEAAPQTEDAADDAESGASAAAVVARQEMASDGDDRSDRSDETASRPQPRPPPPTTGTLSGVVVGTDGMPRAEIAVVAVPSPDQSAAPKRAYTDAAGRYSLAVPPGVWRLHVATAGYETRWWPDAVAPWLADDLTVEAGLTLHAPFRVLPSPESRVIGVVRTRDGQPLPNAVVVAYPNGDTIQPSAGTTADARGAYALHLPPGTYRLSATATQWSSNHTWWQIAKLPLYATLLDLDRGSERTAHFTLGAP